MDLLAQVGDSTEDVGLSVEIAGNWRKDGFNFMFLY